MSVLIKGMEMPKDCYECLARNQGFSGDGMKCGITGSVLSWYDGNRKRMDNCPLVPVPPHGRLIDESKIDLSKYEKAAHDALHNGKGSILYDCGVLAGARAITQLVRRAPTIIPAEEGET